MLNASIDDDKLSEIEFDMFFLLLSRRRQRDHPQLDEPWHARRSSSNPDQWEKFKNDPDRHMAGAIEEILRWATPVLHFRRTALQDYDLGGVEIKEGDKLVIWHISANRDDRYFVDPFRFDIERHPERTRCVRRRRPALLSRRQPRAHGDCA